jgi:uncharacterized protein (DUF1778 family)
MPKNRRMVAVGKIIARPDQKRLFQEAAKIAGLGFTRWVRDRLVEAAQRETLDADGGDACSIPWWVAFPTMR